MLQLNSGKETISTFPNPAKTKKKKKSDFKKVEEKTMKNKHF